MTTCLIKTNPDKADSFFAYLQNPIFNCELKWFASFLYKLRKWSFVINLYDLILDQF
jgi:hypothetical protein